MNYQNHLGIVALSARSLARTAAATPALARSLMLVLSSPPLCCCSALALARATDAGTWATAAP